METDGGSDKDAEDSYAILVVLSSADLALDPEVRAEKVEKVFGTHLLWFW